MVGKRTWHTKDWHAGHTQHLVLLDEDSHMALLCEASHNVSLLIPGFLTAFPSPYLVSQTPHGMEGSKGGGGNAISCVTF